MEKTAEYCLLWIQSGICMPRSDWASWVQAIGSILAILAAVWIALEQSRKQQNAAREAERLANAEKYLLIQSQLAQIEAAGDYILKSVHQATDISWPELVEEIAAAQDSLRSIPRLDLLDGELASRLGAVDVALRRLRVGFELASAKPIDEDRRTLLRSLWEQCREVLRHAAAWAVSRRAATFTPADMEQRKVQAQRATDAASRLEETMRDRQAR